MAFGDATGDGDICLIERRCGRRLEVGEGFALFDQGIQSVSCEGSNCTCDGEHNILASASADSDAGRCAVLDEFCYGDVTASPTGAISVTNAQTEGDETSCSAAVAAEQWVSWDEDTSVGLSGDIWAFCEHRDALTWSCRCASSDSDSDNFELQGPDFTAPHVKGRSIAA